MPAPRHLVAGEHAEYVKPDEIPDHAAIASFAAAMPAKRLTKWWYELMPYVSA